jgi:Zn-dependent protease with chaperone function
MRVDRRFCAVWLVTSVAGWIPLLSGQIIRLSETQEVELGRRAAAEVEFELPLLEDRQVVDYVEALGVRLARRSARSHLRYRFRVINSDDIGAFVLPGGFVYVTRGLIESAADEAELAGVLAHEIGHVAARHHASRIRREKLAALGFTTLGPFLGTGVRAITGRQVGQAGLRGLLQRFSRENEREADRLGAKMLYEAGYDPQAMLSFLERTEAERGRRPGSVRRFFASHPNLEERADNIGDLLELFSPKPDPIRQTAAFERVRERLQSLNPPLPGSSADAAAAILYAEEEAPESIEGRHREVAALFAPLFYQALGEHPRYDYITRFDFDGDWRGDNNWNNAADKRFLLEAWVYYNVRETPTHWFLHYAVFHPRDYKGGKRRGRLLSRVLRTGVDRLGAHDPTGRAQELVLAHENDLEGALVVVEKHGEDPSKGRVVFIETLAHNAFHRYVPESAPRAGFATVPAAGRRVKLYIEPKGHGIYAYTGEEKQLRSATKGFRLYTFTGQAEPQPDSNRNDVVGYDLAPLSTTLWALALRGLSPTYAETEDYGLVLVNVVHGGLVTERAVRLNGIGSAFRGKVGGANLARPPWAWFDGANRGEPLGQWYFDPARTIRDHFQLGEEFSTAYLQVDFDPAAADAEAAAAQNF